MDFGEDRPRETSKSLISILIFFLAGHWPPAPLVYATGQSNCVLIFSSEKSEVTLGSALTLGLSMQLSGRPHNTSAETDNFFLVYVAVSCPAAVC